MQTGAQVANQAVQGILSRVDALAQKIGTTAAQLWQVYVYQGRVEGTRDLAGMLASLAFAALLFFKLLPYCQRKLQKVQEVNRFDGDGWVAGIVFSCIASVALVVVAALCGYDALGEFLNPQYWAFQHLTQDLKNLF